MQNAAMIPPSATVLNRLRIFTGSTCRTSRELSILFTVKNSTTACFFPRLPIATVGLANCGTNFGLLASKFRLCPATGCSSLSGPIHWYAVAISHLLRAPELRASRSLVRCLLFFAGHNHMLGEHSQRSRFHAFLERLLHRAVLPGVVGQHHPA